MLIAIQHYFLISELGDRAPYPGGIVLSRYEELPGLCTVYARQERAADRDRCAAQDQASLKHLALSIAIQAALTHCYVIDTRVTKRRYLVAAETDALWLPNQPEEDAPQRQLPKST